MAPLPLWERGWGEGAGAARLMSMTTERIRELRQNMTNAERMFWRAVRARQIGAKILRQFPIGPYVVDFICLERRLVIEIDGGQHAHSATDATRDAWLEAHGFRIVRFWNNEVIENLEGVLIRLGEHLSG